MIYVHVKWPSVFPVLSLKRCFFLSNTFSHIEILHNVNNRGRQYGIQYNSSEVQFKKKPQIWGIHSSFLDICLTLAEHNKRSVRYLYSVIFPMFMAYF